jgi:hypothetical protein
MVTYDHYKEARELAEQLREEKIGSFADKIIGAIEEGSTGTEIFMALRWNIKNLLKTKDYLLSITIRDKASRLYKELDKALQ